jgi:hypothetical protein
MLKNEDRKCYWFQIGAMGLEDINKKLGFSCCCCFCCKVALLLLLMKLTAMVLS